MIRFIIANILAGITLVFVWSLVLRGCTSNKNLVNRVMSYEDEKELGEEIYQEQIETGQDGVLIEDHYLDSVLQVVLHTLTDHLTDSQYDYTVQILGNPEVNAFTIPGGHIFYFSSMLKEIKNAEQCAAIMAHEIGHNENRDVVRRMIESFGLQALLAANPTIINDAMAQIQQLGFERSQEDQADHFAYKLMVKAGIHPKYFAQVMEGFEKMDEGQAPPEILSDHPSSERRMNEAINYPVPQDFQEVPIKVDWTAFMARLDTVIHRDAEKIQSIHIEVQ